MIDRNQLARWWRIGRRIVLARPQPVDAAETAEWEHAAALWGQAFVPFSPVTEGADVLEVGCGDGRLLGLLLTSGGVRSAAGVERCPFWDGDGGGVPWNWRPLGERLELHPNLDRLLAFDERSFDLLLCRELDSVAPLATLPESLSRLYSLLRPGGEALVRVRCAAVDARGFDGPGYGFMTPTAWVVMFMRAGFELVQSRSIWHEVADQPRAAEKLPLASDDERLAAEVHLHLIRPWESWELDEVRDFGLAKG